MDSTTPKKLIGITGGPGCGKTTFATELARLGAFFIDVDQVATDLVNTSDEIQAGIRQIFGAGFFDAAGRLKRRDLGRLVFSDAERLSQLTRLTTPPMLETVKLHIQKFRDSAISKLCVIDMAILYECQIESWFDCIVVVTATLENRIRRLKRSRRWDDLEIQNRLASQMNLAQKENKADWVIQNDTSLEDLREKAKQLYTEIIRGM